MPLIFKETVKKVDECVGFECNVCKREFDSEDYINMQEVLHWRNECGYGSVFGDGERIELTICQECQKELLGKYMTFHEG